MPLFLPRVIEKNLGVQSELPPSHHAVLDAWATNLAAGVYDSETQNDGEFIQRILIDVLGYVGSSAGATWTVAKNQPIGSGNVDVALGTFDPSGKRDIQAPFELKGAKTKDLDAIMAGRHKSPVQQAWEYAMDAKGASWVLVSNYRVIRLYAIGYGRKDYEEFDLSAMTKPENYNRFILLLSADHLLGGLTLRLLKDSDAAEKEITAELYKQYRETRTSLINEILIQNSTGNPLDAVETAQTILDRILFIAFAEDKGLLKKGTLKEAFELKNPYSPQPAWANFIGLFEAIDKGNSKLNIPGYNGGLFAYQATISQISLSDEMCAALAGLGSYDYDTEVSVNILGHIFEQSISDIEDIKKQLDPEAAPLEEVGSKRRRDGIFYTPPFITQYMVEQIVGNWLGDRKRELGFDDIQPLTDADYASIKIVGKRVQKLEYNSNVQKHINIWESYRDCLARIRVIDPACGSGAFLNEVFDFLYREGQIINRTLETFHGGQTNLFRWDSHILANNLYGVDINRESVEITKLSLWLKTANRNEKLGYLDDNIKTGNSLIKSSDIAGRLAFDWKKQFPNIMDNGGFDIVIGNPPYVDSEAMSKFIPKEREYLTNNFKHTRGNWDLYIAFLELGCDLLSETGYLSYITPDKWLAKDFGAAIRERVLPGIMSILPVGRGVFESALVDSIITAISARPVPSLGVLGLINKEVIEVASIDKSSIDKGVTFDKLLSASLGLLEKMESTGHVVLGSFAKAENACATSDTYVLGEILIDLDSTYDYDAKIQYKVANTGTLSPYILRWGSQPMRYLKKDYTYPVVLKSEFEDKLGATYRRRAKSPKVIIKGLTLLDGALDLEGAFIPGKSTIVVCDTSREKLKFISGILNSKIASFYVRKRYASASYNGGVVFKPEMIDSIPVPTSLDQDTVVKCVDRIVDARSTLSAVTAKLHGAIRAAGAGAKLRRNLHAWYELDRGSFLKELEREGLPLTVKSRSEWAELHDESRAKAHQAVRDLGEAMSDIDNALADAFGLSDDEFEEISRS